MLHTKSSSKSNQRRPRCHITRHTKQPRRYACGGSSSPSIGAKGIQLRRQQPKDSNEVLRPDTSKHERGLFIALEGLDHSGKTTQADLLQNELTTKFNIPAQVISFPNDKYESGQQLRSYLKTNDPSVLSPAAFYDLFIQNVRESQDDIRALLQTGITVIADRHVHTAAAYTASHPAPAPSLTSCLEKHLSLISPDIVLYFNVAPEVQSLRGLFDDEKLGSARQQYAIRQQFEQMITLAPTWALVHDKAAVHVVASTGDIEHEWVAPWYKINADLEQEDVTKGALFITKDVIKKFKALPIQRMSPPKDEAQGIFNFG